MICVGSEETGILHILGMLRECLANLQTQVYTCTYMSNHDV